MSSIKSHIPIAILRGNFDPPHRGHLAVMRHLTDSWKHGLPRFQQVWLVPSLHPRGDRHATDFALRRKLCELAIQDAGIAPGRVVVKDVSRRFFGDDVLEKSLRFFAEEFPGHRFSLAVGADEQNKTLRWYDTQPLDFCTVPYVFPRPGFSAVNRQLGIEIFSDAIKGSEVRARLKHVAAAPNDLSQGVAQFIETYRLYQHRKRVGPYETVSKIELIFEDDHLQHRHLGVSRWALRNHYPNGDVSPIYFCEALQQRGLDSVGVLLYELGNKRDPTVYLRRNLRPARLFRHAPLLRDLPRPLMLPEPTSAVVLGLVAGILEEQDQGRAGIRQRACTEIREEAGYEVSPRALASLGAPVNVAVGTNPELLHLFAAKIDPRNCQAAEGDGSVMEEVGGLVSMPLSQALESLGKSIQSAVLEVCLHRFAAWIKKR